MPKLDYKVDNGYITKQIFTWIIGLIITVLIVVFGVVYNISRIEDEYQQGKLEEFKEAISDAKIRLSIIEVEVKTLKSRDLDDFVNRKESHNDIKRDIEVLKNKIHNIEIKVSKYYRQNNPYAERH